MAHLYSLSLTFSHLQRVERSGSGVDIINPPQATSVVRYDYLDVLSKEVFMLNLHSGGKLVPYEELVALQTPARTETHVPLPHWELVNMVKYSLGYFGHEIATEDHAVTEDGQRYFGLLSLRSTYGDYTDTLGLRNSHDRKFPIGIAFGSKVFVCSNLSFMGDHVIKRKHTANSKRDLPGLVAQVVEPLKEQRVAQQLTFQRYRDTPLTDQLADHTIMELFRKGVIGVQRIADVEQQWRKPEHDWGDKSAWRIFNAATFALTGKVAETPSLTRQLHQVIDGVCETVH